MSGRLPTIKLNERTRGHGPTGMAGEIVAIMEDRMAVGHYQAGEMLSFGKLAEEFGVSRQPVSIAVSHLRTLGYVDIVPQVGCRVASPSHTELIDFFTVLGRIEGAIAAMAAERHEGREAEDFLAIAPGSDFARMSEVENRLRYVNYIHEFHDQIWRMARTPLLFGQLRGLRRLSSFYLWQGRQQLTPEAAEILTQQRNQIASLIVDRKADEASVLMERHIREKPGTVGLRDQAPH